MNISSIIIKVVPDFDTQVAKELTESSLCEVHHIEDCKIIATIEGPSAEVEVNAMRTIERLKHVLSVELVYSYTEEELDKERDKVAMGADLPEWLNDNTIDAKDIPYGGNLKKKF